MFDLLSRSWWTLVVRGIFAILFGILAFLWPGLTVVTLVIFFGAYALVDGIFAIVGAIGGWGKRDDHWLLLLGGLVGVGIGILTFRAPGVTTMLLVIYIAAWGLSTGILEIVAAIRLRNEIKGEWWLILSGIASVLFALLLMIFPGAGALSLIWLIASYAVVFGAMLIGLGLKLRWHRSQRKTAKL
jgi:uncharacterized membrane protein HdeD (DUF308 family)